MTCEKPHDVIIVGAGPAGLTAGMYLGRYCREVLILHDRTSRAMMIPKSHNLAGFPDGLGGDQLLARMECHALRHQCQVDEAHIRSAWREKSLFAVEDDKGNVRRGRALIIATGVTLRLVPLGEPAHQQAIDAGVLRYCPICDGYEHRNQRVAVIGEGDHAAKEALFLSGYSKDVTLLCPRAEDISPKHRMTLKQANITVMAAESFLVEPGKDGVAVSSPAGPVEHFDVLYPALGCEPNNVLLAMLCVDLDDEGCPDPLATRDTGVAGLFAAGDILPGLDQISVAIGHGAIAATSAHNWLLEQDGIIPST
jgi:thioredoxin reductase (NADPH)